MKPIFAQQITRTRRAIGDYVPSGETNVKLTIAKARRRIAQEKAEQTSKVTPIKRREKA